jgi:glucose-6-phosphate isomerase
MAGATPSQAWAILKRHARDEITPLRLLELCRDNDRVSSLVTVYNSSDDQHMVMVDLSRQRMTLETVNHLMRLARARDIKAFITRLAWGGNSHDSSILPSRSTEEADEGAGRFSDRSLPVPSYHLSLRAPRGSEMLLENGENAVTIVHREWDRIQGLAESLRRGQLPGVTGQMIHDVVVVGQGVTMMALRFVYSALCKDEQATISRKVGLAGRRGAGKRRMRYVTSVDPVRVASAVSDLDPASTLVVTTAITGKEEIILAAGLLQSWLFKSLGVLEGRRSAEQILAKHMVFISANERLAIERRPETIFVLPSHSRCEPFTSFTSPTLFPLAVVFGWPIVEQFIQGSHDMDSHFVETNPRHNLPVLLALTDVWNESFLQASGRVVTPFSEALADYPAFCASVESQTCGNAVRLMIQVGPQVIDGGLHNIYDRSLYQSNKLQPTELVMMLDPQLAVNTSSLIDKDETHAAQDALLCSLFAHADELAFGSSTTDPRGFLPANVKAGDPTLSSSEATLNMREHVSEGNRPSALVLCGRLDAFACGQLVALAEHRAVIKARIWDFDPFVQDTGSTLRASRTESLKETLKTMFIRGADDDDEEEAGEPNVNLSTKTILRHYSRLTRDQRLHQPNGGSH